METKEGYYVILDLKNKEQMRSPLDGKTVYFETWADAHAWLWETYCRDNHKYDKLKDVFADFRICGIDLFESFTKPKLSDEERTILQIENRAWDEGGLEELLRSHRSITEKEIDLILAETGMKKIGTAEKGMPTADDYRSPFAIDFKPKEFNGKPLNLETLAKVLRGEVSLWESDISDVYEGPQERRSMSPKEQQERLREWIEKLLSEFERLKRSRAPEMCLRRFVRDVLLTQQAKGYLYLEDGDFLAEEPNVSVRTHELSVKTEPITLTFDFQGVSRYL